MLRTCIWPHFELLISFDLPFTHQTTFKPSTFRILWICTNVERRGRRMRWRQRGPAADVNVSSEIQEHFVECKAEKRDISLEVM